MTSLFYFSVHRLARASWFVSRDVKKHERRFSFYCIVKSIFWALVHLWDALGPALPACLERTNKGPEKPLNRCGCAAKSSYLATHICSAWYLKEEITLKFLIRRVHESPMQPTSLMHPTLFFSPFLASSLSPSLSLHLQLLHTGMLMRANYLHTFIVSVIILQILSASKCHFSVILRECKGT